MSLSVEAATLPPQSINQAYKNTSRVKICAAGTCLVGMTLFCASILTNILGYGVICKTPDNCHRNDESPDCTLSYRNCKLFNDASKGGAVVGIVALLLVSIIAVLDLIYKRNHSPNALRH